jgi:Tfp pilus assembly protein PilV
MITGNAHTGHDLIEVMISIVLVTIIILGR